MTKLPCTHLIIRPLIAGRRTRCNIIASNVRLVLRFAFNCVM